MMLLLLLLIMMMLMMLMMMTCNSSVRNGEITGKSLHWVGYSVYYQYKFSGDVKMSGFIKISHYHYHCLLPL